MRHKGFTLIELLVTVAIIGILAAISIAMFQEYRRKANDSIAIAQVHDAVVAFSAAKVNNPDIQCGFTIHPGETLDNPQYGVPSDTGRNCLPGFTVAPNVLMSVANNNTGDVEKFYIIATHCDGSVSSSGSDLQVGYNNSSGFAVFSGQPIGTVFTTYSSMSPYNPARAGNC